MTNYKTIAESKNFIVLDKYTKEWQVAESYQSEYDLEREFIEDLQNQGYEYLPDLTNPEAMLANVREQLQCLNNVQFSNGEWLRFVETYLDKPSDGITDKTRKIHDDYIMILCSTMGAFKIFTCSIKTTLPATKCRSSNSLNKPAATPIVTMSLFW